MEQTIKELKKKAQSLVPIVNIGKNGVTDGVAGQINLALKKNKLIKIKLNHGAIDNTPKKELILEIIQKTESEFVDCVGFNLVLRHKNKKQEAPISK